MSRKFTVPIELPADPVNPLEAVTKQYVDARAGNEVTVSPTDPILTDPGVEMWYDPTATPAEQLAQEVFIGPDDPGSGYELWYDSDAPITPAVPTLFASVAARDAAMPAATGNKGSLCITLDLMRMWLSDGTAWRLISGSMPRCHMYIGADQSITISGPTLVALNTKAFDTDNIGNTTTSRMTVPAGLGGVWTAGYNLRWAALASGTATFQESWMLVNGVAQSAGVRNGYSMSSEGSYSGSSGSADLLLNAGDYVEVYAGQGNSGSIARVIQGSAVWSRFYMTYRGPA